MRGDEVGDDGTLEEAAAWAAAALAAEGPGGKGRPGGKEGPGGKGRPGGKEGPGGKGTDAGGGSGTGRSPETGRGTGSVAVTVAVRRGPATAVHGDPRAVFEIGSLTKVFTALVLARSVVEGVVDLDEPVAALLPPGTRVPDRDGVPITLRHLATHTSGLPRLPAGSRRAMVLRRHRLDPYARYTPERTLRALRRTRLLSRPGERFEYSNLGGGLLGLALGVRAGAGADGDGYGKLVRRLVCDPLGMLDTRVRLAADQQIRVVQGHDENGDPVPAWTFRAMAGAGALRSTAKDLLAFARAQLRPPPGPLGDAVRLTHERQRDAEGGPPCVHLGWLGLPADQLPGDAGRVLAGAGEVLWHNGGTGGFRSFLGMVPAAGTAVAVLSGSARSVDDVALRLLARVSA